MSDFWKGTLSPKIQKHLLPGETDEDELAEFAEKFDVHGVVESSLLGIVEVKIAFHANPEKEYTFEIDEEDYDPDKLSIAKEVLRQLQKKEKDDA